MRRRRRACFLGRGWVEILPKRNKKNCGVPSLTGLIPAVFKINAIIIVICRYTT